MPAPSDRDANRVHERQRRRYVRRVKPALDMIGSALLLVASAPVHGACAVVILLDTGRPIYFRQERVGRAGVPFDIIKFRTMQPGTHELSKGYPTPDQITRSGSWLRRTSLDEIPQLLNILKGDMSFIGPRPTLRDQVERYSPRQRLRLLGRPGVTGLAQTRYRNNAPWSVRIESDIEYLLEVSFMSDLRILMKTFSVAATGEGQAAGQTQEMVDDL